MIVEFTGCTSAGKSWIVDGIKSHLVQEVPHFISAYDFVLSWFHVRGITNSPRLKSLLVDLLLIPWSVTSAVRYRGFLLYSIKRLGSVSLPIYFKLNILRNLLKTLALFQFIRLRCDQEVICILDEGPVHSLNNVFVHYGVKFDSEVIVHLLKSIPFSDLIVLVTASPETIANRALKRHDTPWKNLTKSQWVALAYNADSLFNLIKVNIEHSTKIAVVPNNGDRSETELAIRKVMDLLKK
jgi:hypothetical protein